MTKSGLVGLFVLGLWVIGCVPGAQPIQARATTRELGSKWLDISVGPDTVTWFNAAAQPHDIARIDHLPMLDLLDDLSVGQRLVVIKSIDEAEQVLAEYGDRIDIIGYNLESGPGNLAAEQADPVGSTQRMRTLADQYGVKLAVGPDHAIALRHGVEMASFADMLILQVQRVQDEHETVRDFVLPMVASVRAAAPEVEIGVQIGAEGNVTDLLALFASMEDEVDGISILTDHESTDFLEQFVTELRPQALDTPTASSTFTSSLSASVPPIPTIPPGSETPEVQTSATLTGAPTMTNAHVVTAAALASMQGDATPGIAAGISSAVSQPSVSQTADEEERVWPARLAWVGVLVAGVLGSGLVITAILYVLPQRDPS